MVQYLTTDQDAPGMDVKSLDKSLILDNNNNNNNSNKLHGNINI